MLSVLVPTRERPAYLEVALASLAPQLDADAEVVVVEDDAPTDAVRAVCERFGARHLAHGRQRGLNAARNTAIDAARGDVLAFIDDDVRLWPGWLAALRSAIAAHPGAEVFGGPIIPRLEGFRYRMCGREDPPITTLAHDAGFAWGANMTVRRSALERIGRFDPALGLYGDEEDWQRRLKAAGGRVVFVPGAGLEHRRAPQDATIEALSRAAYFRGRASRRYDVHKGVAPPLRAELRVLAGTTWHAGRYRCANGLLMAVRTLGRLREALGPRQNA